VLGTLIGRLSGSSVHYSESQNLCMLQVSFVSLYLGQVLNSSKEHTLIRRALEIHFPLLRIGNGTVRDHPAAG
jgi:hypothetical protein